MRLGNKTLGFCALALAIAGCGTTPSVRRLDINALVREAPDAATYVQSQIAERSVVFISESHSVVNPVLFLTRNIEALHGAGLRYLFLEGGFPALPGDAGYWSPLFLPWSQAGWKYEEVGLAMEVRRLNATLPEAERIRVVSAEEGLKAAEAYDPGDEPAIMNGRDSYAFRTIDSVMKSARPGDKALVFYGGLHGARSIWKAHKSEYADIPAYDWKPLGASLAESRGGAFYSFDYRDSFIWGNSLRVDGDLMAGRGPVCLGGASLARSRVGEIAGKYDAIIFDREPIYGTGYQYVPTDENLSFMYGTLSRLARDPGLLAADPSGYRYKPLGTCLMDIYYLKLYYGDSFPYSLWNPAIPLADASEILGARAFSPGQSPSGGISGLIPAPEALRGYMRLMRESGIEALLKSGGKNREVLPQIIRNMEKARRIFPADLWPSYWLAYALTESGRYTEAEAVWDAMVESPLARCMEVYPRILEMASLCKEKTGGIGVATEYRSRAACLRTEFGMAAFSFPDVL